MIFLAFCGLSFFGHKTGLSGRVFIVALSKSVHNYCFLHQAQASVPGAQSQSIWPPSIVSQAHRLQGRRETNVGQWPLEDGVDGWVPWEAVCIFSTAEAMEPQLINNFATAASWTFKDFGTSSEGDCNTELIRDWASFQRWQLGTLLTRRQCDSLVQQVTDSGSKGYWCLAGSWVYPCRQGRPRLLVFPFLVVMNHGVWTSRQLHRLHPHKGFYS